MLEINKLNFIKDGNKILNSISFYASAGEIVTLIGPSGCGKSSILKSIVGIHKIAGEIILKGKAIQNLPINLRNTTLVFQDYSLFPHLSTFENMKIACNDRSKILGILEEFEILHLKDKFPHEMSGGEQQRVAILRGLIYKPTLLLLDEPFSNIDAMTTITFRRKIVEKIKEYGITTIVVTHDLDDVLEMGDRCAVMKKAEIIQFDTLENIFNVPSNNAVKNLFKDIQFCKSGKAYCKIIKEL